MADANSLTFKIKRKLAANKYVVPLRYILELLRPTIRVNDFGPISKYFVGKEGLEIGGLSQLFSRTGLYPVYPIARSIDNCNLIGYVESNKNGFPWYPRFFLKGQDLTREATDLRVSDNSYDFALSSHTIEHLANPLKALLEWKRVVKKGGAILVIAPNKGLIFDHRRATTPLSHMIEDYEQGIDEQDTTHFADIKAMTDIGRGNREKWYAECDAGNKTRWRHHHTFELSTLVEIIRWTGLGVVYARTAPPDNIIAMGVKTNAGC